MRVGTTAENAILEVVDKGPGMSQEDALRVFERFYRTDSSRTRSSGGSGLGLSIVDSLVHAHGGTVKVTDGARTGLPLLRQPAAYRRRSRAHGISHVNNLGQIGALSFPDQFKTQHAYRKRS